VAEQGPGAGEPGGEGTGAGEGADGGIGGGTVAGGQERLEAGLGRAAQPQAVEAHDAAVRPYRSQPYATDAEGRQWRCMTRNSVTQKFMAALRLQDASRPSGYRTVFGNPSNDVAASARQADE
jgi:hypothetical protein